MHSYLPATAYYLNMVALFVLLTLLSVKCVLGENGPKLTINQGTLIGIVRKTVKGRTILAFQGIPYAEPPTKHRRFKPPVPLRAWEGVLDATKNHSPCIQDDLLFRLYGVHGDEDCLFLNVYTPKISQEELLPVIVFIHGGGFIVDHANPTLYGPNILLDKDVILVTVNYRLGALGFLSTEDDVVPGNNGLKDQSLALHWVKNNIKHFGGNPLKITIFGQSAGGASVSFHLLSPLSKDLVFAAISSSGVGMSQWALAQKGEALRNARRLATFLNCPTISNADMIECMTQAEAADIILTSNNFYEFNYDPSITFKPVVEHSHANAFLKEYPSDIIKKRDMANVPFMLGITTDDGAMKTAGIYNDSFLLNTLNSNLSKYLPMVLDYHHLYLNDNTQKFTSEIRNFYLNGQDFDTSTKSTFTDMVTDSLFFYPSRTTTVLYAKYSTAPVYFYLFGYRGSTSTSAYFGDSNHDYGVVHCDDLIYLLSSDVVAFEPDENDEKMMEFMTTLWYNFANTGNPTPNDNNVFPNNWNPVGSNELEYYCIRSHEEAVMERGLYDERYQFWKNLHVLDRAIRVKDEL